MEASGDDSSLLSTVMEEPDLESELGREDEDSDEEGVEVSTPPEQAERGEEEEEYGAEEEKEVATPELELETDTSSPSNPWFTKESKKVWMTETEFKSVEKEEEVERKQKEEEESKMSEKEPDKEPEEPAKLEEESEEYGDFNGRGGVQLGETSKEGERKEGKEVVQDKWWEEQEEEIPLSQPPQPWGD
ncbi:hypothetical protein AA313_de0207501 [Arthrobotrys entomopaga]|nr:hypothetical protein AA313_de0207501 [Arthrobotrys entomopaga]